MLIKFFDDMLSYRIVSKSCTSKTEFYYSYFSSTCHYAFEILDSNRRDFFYRDFYFSKNHLGQFRLPLPPEYAKALPIQLEYFGLKILRKEISKLEIIA